MSGVVDSSGLDSLFSFEGENEKIVCEDPFRPMGLVGIPWPRAVTQEDRGARLEIDPDRMPRYLRWQEMDAIETSNTGKERNHKPRYSEIPRQWLGFKKKVLDHLDNEMLTLVLELGDIELVQVLQKEIT